MSAFEIYEDKLTPCACVLSTHYSQYQGEQSALTLCPDGDVVPRSVSVMMKCG